MPESRFFRPRLARGLPPPNMAGRTSAHPESGRLRPADPPQAVLSALSQATSPADEIAALAACERERDRKLILDRLLSRPRPQIGDLANRYSISASRAGQLMERFTARAARWSVRLPRCEDALAALRERGGIMPSPERDSAFGDNVESIVAACDLRLLSTTVEWNAHLCAWMTPAGEEHASTYTSLLQPTLHYINRQRRSWGAFELALLPRFDPVPLAQRVLLTLPRSILRREFRVTDELVVFASTTSPLHNRSRKVLAALGPTRLQDLHDGLRKEHSPVPSTHQLRDILVDASWFRVDSRDLVSSTEAADPQAVLTPTETFALAIFREAGGVVDREWYMHRMNVAGANASLASGVLRHAYIVRHQRGVHGLRGREPRPGQVQAAANAPAVRLHDSLIDFELHADSAVLRYCVAISSAANGRLPLPPALILPTGRWPTYFPDDSLGALRVRGGTLGGLGPWMLEHGVAAGDALVIEIDIDARVMHVLDARLVELSSRY